MNKIAKAVVAIAATTTLSLSFAGCGLVKDAKEVQEAREARKVAEERDAQFDVTVLKVGDTEISGAYYGYYFSSIYNQKLSEKAQAEQAKAEADAAADSAADSAAESTADSSAEVEIPEIKLEDIKKEAQDAIVATKMAYNKAMDAGIKLTEKDEDAINAQIESVRSSVTQQGVTYNGFLDMMETDSETVAQIIREEYIGQLYYASLVQDKFVGAKHILIEFTADDGADGKRSKDEAKKEIDAIKAELDGGADFDKLMNDKCEDPGLESSPDGYVFAKGAMVPEFEAAAFALEMDAVSDVVETSYGYHIIKRVETSLSGIVSALSQTADQEVADVIEAEKTKLTEGVKVTETDKINYYKVS